MVYQKLIFLISFLIFCISNAFSASPDRFRETITPNARFAINQPELPVRQHHQRWGNQVQNSIIDRQRSQNHQQSLRSQRNSRNRDLMQTTTRVNVQNVNE